MMNTDTKQRIDALEAKSAQLREELRLVEREIHEARCEIAGVRVGDIVEARDRDEWRVAIVREVTTHSFGARLMVSFATKSGTWSKARRHVSRWRVS